MGCCSSSQAAADPLGKKQAASDRASQLPAGLSFHLPTTGPLSPQDFRQRLVCSPGTQVVYLPNSGYTVKYAYVSFRGYYPEALYKAGQDTACAVSNFGDDPEQIFLGVFDGHGTAGTECSQFAREQVSSFHIAVTVYCVCLPAAGLDKHFVMQSFICITVKLQNPAGTGCNAERFAVQGLSRKVIPQCHGSCKP